jgi:HK97 gp10 family phage protein
MPYRVSWNKKKAPHGHLIEFGTSRTPAYPFIRPAFDHIGRAIKAGQERMSERLGEVTGKL